MSRSGDNDLSDRTSRRKERPIDGGGASGNIVAGAGHGGSDEPYYEETAAQVWKDRVLRRDKKLKEMDQRLERLEAIVERRDQDDARNSIRSEKKHSRRDESKAVDSGVQKKQKEESGCHEPPAKEDLRVWYARQEGGGRKDSVHMPPSPFIPEIVNLKTPWGYQNPKFHVYDGKSDPFAHVRQYRNAMSFHCGEDKLLCNVFPRSLGDMGSEWFEKLPPGSISTFDQVAGLFTQRFMTNQKQPKRMDALHTMIRGENEGMREYAKRYWDVYNSIPEITEGSAISSFKNGFHIDDEIRKSIVIDLPKTMGELMERIEKYACREDDVKMETMILTRRNTKTPQSSRDAYHRSLPNKESHPYPSAYQEQKPQKPAFKVKSMTGVNAAFSIPVERILEKIRDEPYYRPPRKVEGEFYGKALHMRCNYHEADGHQTERCIALRKFLEELVQQGYLSEFVDQSGGYQASTSKKRDNRKAVKTVTTPKAQRPVINVIHGGFRLTNAESRGQIRKVCHIKKVEENEPKKVKMGVYTGSVLSFSDRDLKKIQHPHEDALVLTLGIGKYDVKRALIDPRS